MENFNEIINSEKPTLVDFFATWCGPCKMMETPLENIKTDMGEFVTVLKVDVDQNREEAIKYNVRGVPTFIIFKKGEPVWRQSGAMQEKVLKDKIKEFLN